MQDNSWFSKAVGAVIEEEFDVELSEKMSAEPYFVDFLRDMPELTGKFLMYSLILGYGSDFLPYLTTLNFWSNVTLYHSGCTKVKGGKFFENPSEKLIF